MNDITLIRDYGPDAPLAGENTLADARIRLMAEVTAAATTTVEDTGPAPRRWRRWRWHGGAGSGFRVRTRLLVAAATVTVAVVAAVSLIAAESARTPSRPPTGVTLVAFSTPEFPLAFRPAPADLSAPSFTAEGGRFIAVYLDEAARDDVYLIVYPDRPDIGVIPAPRRVTVDGKPGQIKTLKMEGDGLTEMSLTWERKPGQWVGVTGHGRYADEASILALAATVVDEPQPVPLELRLAPAGWVLDAFKADTILTLRDTEDPSRTLSVQAIPRTDPDIFHQVMGARRASTVQINGRASQLIETEEQWFLQAPLPDGSAFNLQAPLLLTPEQVIAIAEQVSRN